ncbi:ribosomal protein S18-alanine N-acetyltransferase [Demequina sp.]|uniref:ribosomal protein S18-alanine N-acetyltransferase n=1 Tax=Demequina sp. TaxID=2050685 RepID=UPI003D1189C9
MTALSQPQLRDLTEAELTWVAEQEKVIFGPAAWSLALIRDDFDFGGKRYRGAEVEGELVGYAVYGYDGDAFSLMNIAVVLGARRGGVGRALMDDFLAEAGREGAREAWLEVSVANTAALALYRSYGFEDVRIRPRYYQPENEDALVMRRKMTDRVA